MDSWFARRPVRDMRPGEHAGLAYATREERDHIVGAFVRYGLSVAHKVIYVSDAQAGELPGLGGIDPLPYLENGRLRLLGSARACLTGGVFDPDRLYGTLSSEITRAQAEGHSDIRVTLDSSWVLEQPGGFDRLLACERMFDEAFTPSTTVMAVCQIDAAACSREQLQALGEVHEVVAVADPQFEDAVLRITPTFQPCGLLLDGEIDASRHAVFTEALWSVAHDAREVHLDLAQLRFIDLGGLRMLAEFAVGRAERGPLVLDHVPSQLRNVMEIVGWHLLPGLRLGEVA
jgi:anti-anti-sigma regulatory factor